MTAFLGGAQFWQETNQSWSIVGQGETEWRDIMYGKGVTTTTK
ncbi:MAG: hypothetical protein WCP20_11610 [Desulfuromonadales bacterium]